MEGKLRLPLADRADTARDVSARIQEKAERVHILTGPVCNNNCIFCMEEDREGRKILNSQTDDALVDWILEQNAPCEEVCFTSGEPTMNKSLPRWVQKARKAGVDRVSVMTNARALSYLRYAQMLVKAGMNRFYVSIHGHTARLHESLVRTPGAFDQTVEGIRNITKLKRYGVELHTSTVVTKRNLPHLKDIYRFLRALGVDQVVFNIMQANGRADTYFERIFPRYSDIAAEAARFVEGETGPVMAFFVDIPLCTTTALPDFNRGFVEAYKHYEPDDGSAGGHDVRLKVLDRAEDEEGPVAVRRSDLDDDLRQKRAECRSCRYDAVCEGVWSNYLKRFGWDEMVPVPFDD
ncbi:MAG: radical SAM protein HxsC4 [Myxococcota bacterium]